MPNSVGHNVYTDGPVQIGSFTLPFGPYRVQRSLQPNTYRQNGINAWIINNYGWFPEAYTLVGFATEDAVPFWADASMRESIAAQFNDPGAVVPFLVPYQGINTTVRLISLDDQTDASSMPGETVYTLSLEECDGTVTLRGATSAPPNSNAGAANSGGNVQ